MSDFLTKENYLNHMINLDISNKCILQCPRCMRQGKDFEEFSHRNEDISLENFTKLAKYFKNLDFCGQQSDPIYHSQFLDILKICNRYARRVRIGTNGYGKKDHWWDKAFFLTSNPKVNYEWRFALDGLPNESHIYRVKQDGNQVFEVMKKGAKMGIHISWQYIVFRYNEDHIDEARQMALDNGIDFVLMKSSRWIKGDPYKPSKYALKDNSARGNI